MAGRGIDPSTLSRLGLSMDDSKLESLSRKLGPASRQVRPPHRRPLTSHFPFVLDWVSLRCWLPWCQGSLGFAGFVGLNAQRSLRTFSDAVGVVVLAGLVANGGW
jgi:hypothetical protein